ncbi:unnamed protein product [Paramecium pentaurelia]|uniref:Uncharacterized protein n=1 Tax=Paramecium pentaurelia TaxID=43138 RepID=A0A8S1XKX6_9CILI|nr:unnamed protein product [Paramecium pentaurelia]
MAYNLQHTSDEGFDIHSSCNDQKEYISELYSNSDLYSESQHSSDQSKVKLINHMDRQEKQLTNMNDNLFQIESPQTDNLYYLNQFLKKKRYWVIQNFFQIKQQKYIKKNYPSLIFSLFLNSDQEQIQHVLNLFLEKKYYYWKKFCDFNQFIIEKVCKDLKLQYENLKKCNQDFKEQQVTNEPNNQNDSMKQNDSMRFQALLEQFQKLCNKNHLIITITRFEYFEEGLKKIEDIENQCKEKNLQDNQLLQHLNALKEFITITQTLKNNYDKYDKSQRKYIKKQIDITKEDILKLMEDPLIKEKSQDVLNIISNVLNILNIDNKKIDQNQNSKYYFDLDEIKKLDKIQWRIFYEKANALLNSENSPNLQSKKSKEAMNVEQERMDQNTYFWQPIKKVKL